MIDLNIISGLKSAPIDVFIKQKEKSPEKFGALGIFKSFRLCFRSSFHSFSFFF